MTEFLLSYYDTPLAGVIIFSMLFMYGIVRAKIIVRDLKVKKYIWQDNFSSDFFIILMTWPNTWMPLVKMFSITDEAQGMLLVLLSLLTVIFLIYAPLRIYLSLQRHYTAQLN